MSSELSETLTFSLTMYVMKLHLRTIKVIRDMISLQEDLAKKKKH